MQMLFHNMKTLSSLLHYLHSENLTLYALLFAGNQISEFPKGLFKLKKLSQVAAGGNPLVEDLPEKFQPKPIADDVTSSSAGSDLSAAFSVSIYRETMMFVPLDCVWRKPS